MSSYIVRYGETITDVILNTTGTLVNWSAILYANGFTEWVPVLFAGQVITIPDELPTDPNTLRQLAEYPANNQSVSDVYTKINIIFDTILNDWILTTGFWNDNAFWIDTKIWIDALV